jgi:predicted small metal-binding protein
VPRSRVRCVWHPVQAIKTAEIGKNLGYHVEGEHGERFVSGEKISVFRTIETSPTLYDADK